MKFKNKRAQGFITGVYWFFFSIMFITGVIFFFLTAFPAILYTYGIDTAVNTNQNLVDLGVSSEASQTRIEGVADSFNNLYTFGDYAFLFMIIGLVIQSFIASSQASRSGIFSFFGYMTIGNIILVFLLSYAVHFRDWFLNEIVYTILTISIETPFFTWFFTNSYYIGMVWYILLLFINIIDFKALLGRMPFLSRGTSGEQINFEE